MNVVEGDLTYLVNMAVHPERFVQHNAKVPHTGRTINLSGCQLLCYENEVCSAVDKF